MYQSMCGDFDDKEDFYETVEKYTPPTTGLRAFCVSLDGIDDEEQPALLVFEKTAEKARELAMEYAIKDGEHWEISFGEDDFKTYFYFHNSEKLSVAEYNKYHRHMFRYADQEDLIKNKPHIGIPKGCEKCEVWGNELNRDGLCWDCYYT